MGSVTYAIPFVVIGLTVACSSSAVRTQQDLNPSYDFSNFSLYHQVRDTRLIVMGDTFGLDPQVFGERVAAAMQGQHVGRPTHFTTRPGATASKNFRVVMAFNVAPTRYGLCENKTVPLRPIEGQTVLQAAWCWDTRTESYVRAWTATTGPGEPRFQELIARATFELFPPRRNRDLNDDRDRRRRMSRDRK